MLIWIQSLAVFVGDFPSGGNEIVICSVFRRERERLQLRGPSTLTVIMEAKKIIYL